VYIIIFGWYIYDENSKEFKMNMFDASLCSIDVPS
jgi:hypothetical protein